MVEDRLNHEIGMLKKMKRERPFRANMQAGKFQRELSEPRFEFFSNMELVD
jgi:hypothetical protein